MFQLRSLEIWDFRSIAYASISFPLEEGLNFLGGENLVEPRLGANGSGKSSVWDAVCWMLYGASTKGTRSSALVSWGKKNITGSLTFSIFGKIHHIIRTSPPMKIMLDTSVIEQKELDILPGLTLWRFTNSVIFGQGRPLFPDLSVGDRGELLDEVLDLKLWNNCSIEAGWRNAELETALHENEKKLAYLDGRLSSLPDEVVSREKIELKLKGLEAAEKELDKLPPIEDIGLSLDAAKVEEEWMAHRIDRRIREDELAKVNKRLSFLFSNKTCPTCTQSLEDATLLDKAHTEKGFLEHEIKVSKTAEDAAFIRKQEAFRRINEQAKVREKHSGISSVAHGLEKEIAELLTEIETAKATKLDLELEKLLALDHQATYSTQSTAATYWKNGFKRIRLFFIERILSALSIEIQSALSNLGLVGWEVKLCTESETKSGTTKLGVQIHIKSPIAEGPWDGWSGGESQRLRLGIAMGLASMIQRQAGVKFGFEVWDEPTAWLGTEGVEDLLQALQYRAETQHKSIWVVDHRALTSSAFQEIWMAKKTSEGTSVYKVE